MIMEDFNLNLLWPYITLNTLQLNYILEAYHNFWCFVYSWY